jgi:hypothetical protein
VQGRCTAQTSRMSQRYSGGAGLKAQHCCYTAVLSHQLHDCRASPGKCYAAQGVTYTTQATRSACICEHKLPASKQRAAALLSPHDTNTQCLPHLQLFKRATCKATRHTIPPLGKRCANAAHMARADMHSTPGSLVAAVHLGAAMPVRPCG